MDAIAIKYSLYIVNGQAAASAFVIVATNVKIL